VSRGEREVKNRAISFDAEGRGAINAINGLKMEIDPGEIKRGPIPAGSEIVPPRLMREDVEEEIVQEVTELLTQRIRFRYEKGDTIFYEEKTLKPDRNNIRVELETVYVPVWQIRGGSKIVEVNAFSGEILSMPMDEGVELSVGKPMIIVIGGGPAGRLGAMHLAQGWQGGPACRAAQDRRAVSPRPVHDDLRFKRRGTTHRADQDTEGSRDP